MDPEILSTREVYKHPIVCLKEDEYRVKPDKIHKTVRFVFPDWVSVIAINQDKEIILVEQFRYGTATKSIELPGGGMGEAEDPIDAGLRELWEETGYIGILTTKYIGSCFVNPSCQNNKMHVVYCEVDDDVVLEPHPDEDEEIKVIKVPIDRFNHNDSPELFARVPSLLITAIGMAKLYYPMLMNAAF